MYTLWCWATQTYATIKRERGLSNKTRVRSDGLDRSGNTGHARHVHGHVAHECVSVWWCGHMGMFARWHIGVLVHCMLVCRHAVLCIASACGSVGSRIHVAALVHQCIDVLACWHVGVLACWHVGVLVCWCVGALACGVGALMCRWRGDSLRDEIYKNKCSQRLGV
jgi:hypothetical protein